MRIKTKILAVMFAIILIALPVAVRFDYSYYGFKSEIGYLFTCGFEIMIFLSGFVFGNTYGNIKEGGK